MSKFDSTKSVEIDGNRMLYDYVMKTKNKRHEMQDNNERVMRLNNFSVDSHSIESIELDGNRVILIMKSGRDMIIHNELRNINKDREPKFGDKTINEIYETVVDWWVKRLSV